jgi:hypothetical protein
MQLHSIWDAPWSMLQCQQCKADSAYASTFWWLDPDWIQIHHKRGKSSDLKPTIWEYSLQFIMFVGTIKMVVYVIGLPHCIQFPSVSHSLLSRPEAQRWLAESTWNMGPWEDQILSLYDSHPLPETWKRMKKGYWFVDMSWIFMIYRGEVLIIYPDSWPLDV